jgi:hypothetical protein
MVRKSSAYPFGSLTQVRPLSIDHRILKKMHGNKLQPKDEIYTKMCDIYQVLNALVADVYGKTRI